MKNILLTIRLWRRRRHIASLIRTQPRIFGWKSASWIEQRVYGDVQAFPEPPAAAQRVLDTTSQDELVIQHEIASLDWGKSKSLDC